MPQFLTKQPASIVPYSDRTKATMSQTAAVSVMRTAGAASSTSLRLGFPVTVMNDRLETQFLWMKKAVSVGRRRRRESAAPPPRSLRPVTWM